MNENFYISTDKSQLDKDLIIDFLSNHSYWAQGRSRQTIEKSMFVKSYSFEKSGVVRVIDISNHH